MTRRGEFWLLWVMLSSGCVLLIGEVIDRDWLRTAMWALAVGAVGALLVRLRSKNAVE